MKNKCTCLCFSVLRYYPLTLRDRLRQEGLWEDLEQELQVAAWEAEGKGLDEHDTCLLASRRVYAFLKAYGYHRMRRDGHKNYSRDIPFSSIDKDPELQERALARATPLSEVPTKDSVRWRDLFKGAPMADFVRDHLQEAILALLEANGSMSKRDLYARLTIPARDLDRHCAPLIEQGLVIEVKRQNTRSRPLTPLLVSARYEPLLQTLPTVEMDRDERIRRAYFDEGKGIKRIAREFHHSLRTVRDALIDAGAEIKGKGRRKRWISRPTPELEITS